MENGTFIMENGTIIKKYMENGTFKGVLEIIEEFEDFDRVSLSFAECASLLMLWLSFSL